VDIGQVTAWKNGEFSFHRAALSEVMNQLARWYDVEVRYPVALPEFHFTGSFKRDKQITRTLEKLEATGGIHFSVKGKILTVMPDGN